MNFIICQKFIQHIWKTISEIGINASKKVIHKAAKSTGEFLENKIADVVAKLYNNKILKPDEIQEMLKK